MNFVAYFRIWSAEIRNLHVVINCSPMNKPPYWILQILYHLKKQNNLAQDKTLFISEAHR
jgi:hypothetical protein